MSKVQLNFWLMPNGDFETGKILEAEIAQFERWHSNIHIEPTIIPWTHAWDRLMNVYKHGNELTPPDVMQIGTTWSASLAYLGVIRDLNTFFDADLTSDILPPLQAGCQSSTNHQWICIPWIADIRMLYYRKDVLKRFGFSVKDLGRTDSFRKVCQTIQKEDDRKKGIAAFRLSGQSEGANIHDLAPWVWANGGDFITLDQKHVALTSPATKEAIKWYFDLIAELYGGSIERYGVLPQGSYFSGRYAMEVIGKFPAYQFAHAKKAEFHPSVVENYGVTQMPQGAKGRYAFIGGSGLAIPSWSRYPEEAAEWIRFLVSPESQLRHNHRLGVFPTRVSLLEAFLMGKKAEYNVVRETLKESQTFSHTPMLGTLEKILLAFSDRVLKAIRFGHYNNEFFEHEIRQTNIEANYLFSMFQ